MASNPRELHWFLREVIDLTSPRRDLLWLRASALPCASLLRTQVGENGLQQSQRHSTSRHPPSMKCLRCILRRDTHFFASILRDGELLYDDEYRKEPKFEIAIEQLLEPLQSLIFLPLFARQTIGQRLDGKDIPPRRLGHEFVGLQPSTTTLSYDLWCLHRSILQYGLASS